MAYRLDPTERIGDSFRRVATEQLDDALGSLGEGGEVAPEAIHAARKSLKKTRSLVRLARPALGRQAYGQANVGLRDAGRLLSGTRDADVMVTTARGLAERAVGHVSSETFELLVSALAEHAVAERREGSGSDAADEARKAIAAIHASTADWSLEDARRRTLVAGLRRTYERGAQQLALLRADPGDVEASHDWRKRVKDLWYQQRLIAPAWPAVLEAQAEEAHVLSEHLGDDHDLAVLEERLAAGVPAVAADLDPVVELIGRRRAELGERSLRLGARVYAESPRAFERRIAGYLAAWRSEVRADGITVP